MMFQGAANRIQHDIGLGFRLQDFGTCSIPKVSSGAVAVVIGSGDRRIVK